MVAKKKDNEEKQTDKVHTELEAKIEALENEIAEQKEITQRAQSDYFRLKLDMDGYIKRAEEAKKSERVDALVSMGGKLLPFITQLEQSIAHIPQERTGHTWIDGIQLIHQKALNDIASLGVMPIQAEIGQDPDLTLHMPINMQETDDDALKGKIVQVVASGRKYDKDGVVQVISPSQIVVGT